MKEEMHLYFGPTGSTELLCPGVRSAPSLWNSTGADAAFSFMPLYATACIYFWRSDTMNNWFCVRIIFARPHKKLRSPVQERERMLGSEDLHRPGLTHTSR